MPHGLSSSSGFRVEALPAAEGQHRRDKRTLDDYATRRFPLSINGYLFRECDGAGCSQRVRARNGDWPTQPAPRSRSTEATFARFREWRGREFPFHSYAIAPNLWTPRRLKQLKATDPAELRMYKRREPQITGIVYDASITILVMVASAASHEHVAKLIHCRALMRRDPDYFVHLGKRRHSWLICDACPAAVRDVARRHHVQIITAAGNSDLKG